MIPKPMVGKKNSLLYFGDQSPTFIHVLQIISICLRASDAIKPFEIHTQKNNNNLESNFKGV